MRGRIVPIRGKFVRVFYTCKMKLRRVQGRKSKRRKKYIPATTSLVVMKPSARLLLLFLRRRWRLKKTAPEFPPLPTTTHIPPPLLQNCTCAKQMQRILKTAPFAQGDHGEYSGGGRMCGLTSGDRLPHRVGMWGFARAAVARPGRAKFARPP